MPDFLSRFFYSVGLETLISYRWSLKLLEYPGDKKSFSWGVFYKHFKTLHMNLTMFPWFILVSPGNISTSRYQLSQDQLSKVKLELSYRIVCTSNLRAGWPTAAELNSSGKKLPCLPPARHNFSLFVSVPCLLFKSGGICSTSAQLVFPLSSVNKQARSKLLLSMALQSYGKR